MQLWLFGFKGVFLSFECETSYPCLLFVDGWCVSRTYTDMPKRVRPQAASGDIAAQTWT